ncbi:MAG: gliding motility-associated C-terminal domain-containing protein [Bacteroidia bacterium]|nr:gliding motility-associated C-terminal domain-containing protein [Bacteroidia bacterium]
MNKTQNIGSSLKLPKVALQCFTLVFLFFAISFKSFACSPLNTPAASSFAYNSTTSVMSFTVSQTSSWLNCQNVIDIEFACINSNFGGLASATWTSAPSSFASSPYTYPTITVSIASFCPGTGYKFRIRERNNGSSIAGSWSSSYTFATAGVPSTPALSLSSSPNVICPPATNQLSATVSSGCGNTTTTYTWVPSTGLSNPNVANPVATLTANTTYTCYASGGQLGCWTASNVITLNLGTSPPIGGTAVATPTSICFGKTVTLSVSGYSGNIQWQSSSSSSGPWVNAPGGGNPTLITPPINNPVCYRVMVTSCSGTQVATSNTVCINTNLSPILTPTTGCTSTLSTVSFSYTNASGSPTAVVWSPTPLSVTNGSTEAWYTTPVVSNFTVAFPDGCVSSGSINIPPPGLSFASNSISCANLGSATVTPINMPTGPYIYYWTPSAQTGSAVTGLYPGVYNVSANYGNGNCAYSTTVNLASSTVFYGTVNNTSMLSCFGVNNGTAAITMSGGTGNYNYTWFGSSSTQTGVAASGLSAGIYTVYVSDAITNCSTYQVFMILQPAPISVTASAVSATACAGATTTLTVAAGGGSSGSGYTYSWVSGPTTSNYVVSQATAGTYIYTVSAFDSNSCSISTNVLVNFISNPVISVPDVSVCPLQTGTLTATGASNYTWTGGSNANTFTANPTGNTNYTVIGSAQTCTSVSSGNMILKPVPVPVLFSNSPVCNNQNLTMSAQGGTAYTWYGPSGFTSTLQSPNINPSGTGNAGIYTVIATAANSCTGAVSASLIVYPTPTVSSVGSTVCSTQVLNLSANSVSGASYLWSGPLGFSSPVQNPSIFGPFSSSSGNYTVKVTSVEGCTNTSVANVTVTNMPMPIPTSDSPKCFGTTLHLSAPTIPGASYSWNGPNGFISTLQNPVISTVTLPAGGLYNLYVSLGPCFTNSATMVVINPLPSPTITSNSPVCETKSLSLGVTALNLTTVVWTGPTGFLFGGANAGRDSCALSASGIYSVTVTDINTCVNYGTTTVTVLSNPTVSAISNTVCFKDEAVLKASGAVSYNWYNPTGFFSNQSNAVINSAVNIAPVIYTVIGSALNTCTSVAMATLATLPLPVPWLQVSPSRKICLNEVVTFKGFGAYGYDWRGPGNFSFAGETISFPANSLNYTGTYTLTAKDIHNCRAVITTSIHIDDLPTGIMGGLLKGCVPFKSDYVFYPSGASASLTNSNWTVDNKTFGSNTFSNYFTSPGEHLIKGTIKDINSCVNTLTFMVNVYPQPVADFTYSPEKPVENFDEVVFVNTSKGAGVNKWVWYMIDNSTFGANEQNTLKYFDLAGTYPVAFVAKSEFGCSDTIVKAIVVSEDFNVFVPDAFSPNGDNLNDVFIPVTRGVKSFNLMVFDRWGAKIFESSDKTMGWNGLTGDKESPVDVYVWKVQVSSVRGEQKTFKGHVMLYR